MQFDIKNKEVADGISLTRQQIKAIQKEESTWGLQKSSTEKVF